MFGKKSKMSSSDKFVTAKGREAGNLSGKKFGNHSGPPGKKGKETPDPFVARTLKVGKNSRFSSE